MRIPLAVLSLTCLTTFASCGGKASLPTDPQERNEQIAQLICEYAADKIPQPHGDPYCRAENSGAEGVGWVVAEFPEGDDSLEKEASASVQWNEGKWIVTSPLSDFSLTSAEVEKQDEEQYQQYEEQRQREEETRVKYAEAVCSVFDDRVLQTAGILGGEADFADPSQMQQAYQEAGPVFRALAYDLGDIVPPSEVADWHSGLIAAMGAYAKVGDVLNLNEFEELEALMEITEVDMSKLPDGYRTAFKNAEACQDVWIFR